MRIEKFLILTMHAKTIDFQKSDFACFVKTYNVRYYNHERIKLRLKGLNPVEYRLRNTA